MLEGNVYIPRRLPAAEKFRDLGRDIFFDVRLTDLTAPRLSRGPGLNARAVEQIRFSVLVCREGMVNAAAEPYRLLPNGAITYITGGDFTLMAGRFDTLPLLSRQAKESGKDLAARVRKALRDSDWAYPFQPLSNEERAELRARRMIEKSRRFLWPQLQSCSPSGGGSASPPGWVPSAYGRLWGVTEGCIASAGQGWGHAVGCTRRAWEALRAPWPQDPLWEQVSLEERLERLLAGRACNPGHSAAAAKKIADAPLCTYIAHLKRDTEKNGKALGAEEDLKKKLGDLSIPYGQAAVEIDRLMKDERTREQGEDLMWDLALCLLHEYRLKEGKK